MVETGVVESDNPYLYDVSGAYKKIIDYGKDPVPTDFDDYEANTQIQEAIIS